MKIFNIIFAVLISLVSQTVFSEVVRCEFNHKDSNNLVFEFTISIPSSKENRTIFAVNETDNEYKLTEDDYISGPDHEFSVATILDDKEHVGVLKVANIFNEVIWFPPLGGNTSKKIMWARIDWDVFGTELEINKGDAEYTSGFGEVHKGICTGFKQQ